MTDEDVKLAKEERASRDDGSASGRQFRHGRPRRQTGHAVMAMVDP